MDAAEGALFSILPIFLSLHFEAFWMLFIAVFWTVLDILSGVAD
jgi:hypothetical protein